jgi:hypothetical protein
MSIIVTLSTLGIYCRYRIDITSKIDKNGDVFCLLIYNSLFTNNRINGINVTDASNDTVIWLVKAENPVCIDTIKFLKIPDGFKEYKVPKKLLINHKYKIFVSGRGVSGSREFEYVR